jgi:Raf kinase inhibitor-like YbhB/YbcL family protein
MLKTTAAILLLVVAVAPSARADDTPHPRTLEVTSPSFGDNELIPAQYTCAGAAESPPLAWSNVPANTKSFAILIEDPDARNYVHWIVTNLPATTTSLPAGAQLPQGAVVGKNQSGKVGYTPPCPPTGKHHYVFRVYALDTKLAGTPMTKDQLLEAMGNHVLAQGALVAVAEKAP